MDNLPCAVIASASSSPPKSIIQMILNVDELPEPSEVEENIKAYPWHIDTKYYTTDINLCSIETKALGSLKFAESVEGLVINFDSTKDDALIEVESWLTFLKEYEPEVKILLCEKCYENPSIGISKIKAQEWCVKNEFELVELDPDLDPEWEEEQDFLETTGVKRIVQALHAHVWPNLKMKDSPQGLPMSRCSRINDAFSADTISTITQNIQNAHISNESNPLNNVLDFELEEFLNGDPFDFSAIYEQLHCIKEQMQSLPSDQRREKAEEVMIAFWKSLGGDNDELSGEIDSEDDDAEF